MIGDVINNLKSSSETLGEIGSSSGSRTSRPVQELHERPESGPAARSWPRSTSITTLSDADRRPAEAASARRSAARPGVAHGRGDPRRGPREIDRALQILPIKLKKIGRTAIYGSFFNFYLCEFQAKVIAPDRQPRSRSYQTYSGPGGAPLMRTRSASATP